MYINILFIPFTVIIINFFMHFHSLIRNSKPEREKHSSAGICYAYHAKTIFPLLNHRYSFRIAKVDNQYRCYILFQPGFREQDTSHYNPHCWIESGTENKYICWTGEIENIKKAKALCRLWADNTQRFIDTGKPAPGFER